MRIKGLTLRQIGELSFTRPRKASGRRHVFLCVADHFEPMWRRPPSAVQWERVEHWVRDYPILASRLADSRGRPPQHTFFFPQDEYVAEHVEAIAGLCRRGFGDIEVHLHHDYDTADRLREKLLSFAEILHYRHGMLRRDALGRLAYAFIHGNWALDNSRPDGRWCGVNDELTVLKETGCYADLTMPAAPSPCQTTTINSIYYAIDDPLRCKSHDRGVRAQSGRSGPDEGLLMIQGPLALDWTARKWGVLPRIENGNLTKARPPSMNRLRLWLQANVVVAGRDDWTFVKLHTHGAQEANAQMFFDGTMRRFHEELAHFAASLPDFRYYYVTSFEMAQLVRQAESGACEPDFATMSCASG